MHLHKKKIVYWYFESQPNWKQEIRNKSIAEVMETSDAAAEEAYQSEEPEIVTDEDEKRKIKAAEALTFQAPTPLKGQNGHFVGLELTALEKLDEVKNFIEVSKSDHLNIIFNELI